jgi:hypothetical protein
VRFSKTGLGNLMRRPVIEVESRVLFETVLLPVKSAYAVSRESSNSLN